MAARPFRKLRRYLWRRLTWRRVLVLLVLLWGLDHYYLRPRREAPSGPTTPAEPTRGAIPYDRAEWPHWTDADGDCQDARQEVLIAESEGPVELDRDGCHVRRGRWRCPYTGRMITDPKQLDVDHMVPLAEAHRSGGDAWTRERRERYANDLDDPGHLVAVERGANRAKGDKGPDAWLPEAPAARCEYVQQWTRVKERWELSIDPVERAAIDAVRQACDRGRTPPRP